MVNNVIELFKNKNIVILGFGKEGKSTYKLLRRYLKDILITIRDENDKVKKDSLLKDDNNIEIITGEEYLSNLEKYDIIMKSPGISFKDLDISKFKNKIYSQLEILLKYKRDKIIGVTGTKGKSTTVSLIYEILKANKKECLLLGNIGNPIFDYIDEITDNTLLVVECSSHQLEFIDYSPKISIITNFYQDHLDHTNGILEYYNAKLNIAKYQEKDDLLIYFEGCNTLDDYVKKANIKSKIIKVNLKENDIKIDTNLLGNHNIINILLAKALIPILSLDIEKTNTAIKNFTPLEHRLELVGTFNDVTFYNDTIATIPEATINGINALEKVNTLIFGGLDRGINYSEFILFLNNSKIENLICMPTTGHKIAKELEKLKTKKKIYIVSTLEEAVTIAKKVTKKNSICLLSPAAASYEYFKNFEEKGNKYKEIIKTYN